MQPEETKNADLDDLGGETLPGSGFEVEDEQADDPANGEEDAQ